MSEARITVNGTALTEAESLTLRVALNSFLMGLQDDPERLGADEHARALSEGYSYHGLRALHLFPDGKGNRDPIDVHQTVTDTVAGVTLFGAADDVAAARAALEAKPLPAYPDELTPDLREVLGWICFQCAPVAHAMRAAGVEIKRKAEDEQAHVLHWMVKLVLRHGASWRAEGSKDINAWLEAARAKAKSKGDAA